MKTYSIFPQIAVSGAITFAIFCMLVALAANGVGLVGW